MSAVASCGTLEIPVAGMDERGVLAVLLLLPLRGRFPASNEVLLEGRLCFRKNSMGEAEREK